MPTDRSLRSITVPRGFAAAATTCGIKPSGAADLAVIAADAPCAAAGVFTKNRCPGEPVKVAKRHLRFGRTRAIVCNSGHANVATGRRGYNDALAMCSQVADALQCDRRQVLPCSTGVIGHRLPIEKIKTGITHAMSKLARGPQADAQAAGAILTTDLVPKTARSRIRLGNAMVNIAGIAKGSGMIAPNMATMLAFLTTDAAIAPGTLASALRTAAGRTFNHISVDEDTSTSDTVLLMASGAANNRPLNTKLTLVKKFTDALTALCEKLAYQIVEDGEGATKVFRVHVEGARSARDADRVGKTIVGSPLIKTMVHGGDPNWGRLIMAVGRSGAAVKVEQLTITIADVDLFASGRPAELSRKALRRVQSAMAKKHMDFTIHLHAGRSDAQWLGCDLSRQYIAINADYTT